MQHSLLIGLNILLILETVLAVSALAACLHAGTRNPVPEMRDYLLLRSANTLAAAIILLWPGESLFLAVCNGLSTLIYDLWFWAVALLLLFLEMRVAAGAIAAIFKDLPGLHALSRVASRWVAVAALIIIIPLLVALIANFDNDVFLRLVHRWWYAFSLLELIPVVFALLVGTLRKVRWSSRTVALLIGFTFEPLLQLAAPRSWMNRSSMMQFGSLAHEIACCAAVALWTLCYAVPEKVSSFTRPTLAMLHLDELARIALRRRLPVASSDRYARKGAQPWPRYRRDPE